MPVDFRRAESAIAGLLPTTARWWVDGVPLDWTFGLDRWSWARGDEVAAGTWEPTEGMGILRVFGDYHYDGGAAPFVALHAMDGTVHGLDVEAEQPVFSFNSSLQTFIQTFRLLDPVLRGRRTPPASIRNQLRALDIAAYDTSEWSILLEHVLDGCNGGFASPPS